MIGALQRIPRLLHILQGLVFAQVGLDGLFDHPHRQQIRPFDPVLEYVELRILRMGA